MARAKYEEWLEKDNLLRLEAWARDGLTYEQIANNMGIAESTFREWRKKIEAISAATRRGKEPVDIEVENALLKRAVGYTYDEVTQELVDGELVVTKVVTKQVNPDVGAQSLWLRNRKPETWRDKQDIQMNANVSSDPLDKLSVEELKELLVSEH